MYSIRFKAVETARGRDFKDPFIAKGRVSEIFGIDVFSKEKMRQYLSKDIYEKVMKAVESGTTIDRGIADQVAEGMKTWAVSRGATHYTHWFQPLNESTAEKHDAFLHPSLGGESFESFSGDLLVQQEPDASSFPSGGLRNTFEARGYSAWDPSSPAFVLDGTLCIPSVFISYNGEALDFKTPLLRSMNAIDKAAVEMCRLFDKEVSRVVPTLGCEQEYFLVDEALFDARSDLSQTGRTLMGHTAAKDQQLDDHYWGAIPPRVAGFMKEFEDASYRLGIPLMTRHNEVAPNQFECAPMFEEANVAVDHNILLMSLMRKIAPKHHLKVLFHEKPFAGINGSGKHCNWSLATNTGVNLLSPGRNPKSNTQFLAFFVSVLKACEDYGSLLMASVASYTNSFRLGGNEAPPSVLSVFCGDTMSTILGEMENKITGKLTSDQKTQIKLHIGKIPEILLDNTDRNRTSPFAFTGNRFEFRAVGSSSNCAMPLIVLNTIVAHELTEFTREVTALVEKGEKKDEAILKVIRKFIESSRNVRFDGNGYSSDWLSEAAARGLKSFSKATDAFKEYLSPEAVKLFGDYAVLSQRELTSRFEIKNETLLKKLQIESRVLADMAVNHIVPTAVRYENVLIENIRGMKEILPDDFMSLAGKEIETLQKIAAISDKIASGAEAMTDARRTLNRIPDIIDRAQRYEREIIPIMAEIRDAIDHLEMIVDDAYWPLVKYRELLAAL